MNTYLIEENGKTENDINKRKQKHLANNNEMKQFVLKCETRRLLQCKQKTHFNCKFLIVRSMTLKLYHQRHGIIGVSVVIVDIDFKDYLNLERERCSSASNR